MTKQLDKPFEVSTICRQAWYDYINNKMTKKELLEKMEELRNKQISLEIMVKESRRKQYSSWRSKNG
jgi:hypothetical protein